MLSRFGARRLGTHDSKPEFGTLSWFAMMFTAGMGIGLVFYGVHEPVSHLHDDFIGAVDDPAATAVQYTLFHWGLHPWAVYIVPGLALGYFCFYKGLPMRPSSALYPLIGTRIHGWIGNLIDILAVFATLFGMATSLGLGTQQIAVGLSRAFDLPGGAPLHIALIITITAIAVISVVSGLDRGIRRLAVLNMWMGLLFLLVVVVLGPKLAMLGTGISGLGDYLQNLVGMSLDYVPPTGDADARAFSEEWTFFYWGWWISWSPFVGMFLARISYGRTIRQFTATALFGPLAVSVLWFGAFGGAGIAQDRGDAGPLTTGSQGSPDQSEGSALYNLWASFELGPTAFALLAVFTILMIAICYITSSDSASLVADMLTRGTHPHPLRLQRVFWASLIGVITIALLIIGGGAAVRALQAVAISTALPFSAVLVLMAVSLVRALLQDSAEQAPQKGEPALGPDSSPSGPSNRMRTMSASAHSGGTPSAPRRSGPRH
ncbi:BCCT family transporter [Nocardiopsis coralliicola]